MVVSMQRWKGKVAIVTGASAGIGAAMATQLVEAGLQVVGLARRKEKVEELAKKLEGKSGQLYGFKIDITKEDDIIEAFKWVKTSIGPVNILVNNAGVSRSTTLIQGDTKLWKDVLETNVLGLCVATREAIKDMKENNVDGHIIHINSTSGHTVTPYTNIYAASKYAVTALTETLRQELNSIGSKIRITSISPGYVDTEIFAANAKASGLLELPKEKRLIVETAPKLQPNDIADAVTYVLSTPSHVQVHELTIRPIGEKS